MATDSATDPLLYTVLSFTSIGLVLNLGSILHKLARQYSIPKLWKYSYLTLDFAHVFLGIGLLLFVIFKFTGSAPVCDAAGFLVQFALFDCVCAFLISGIILLGIYNPGKSTKLSTFHRNVFLVIFIPQKIISIFISALPFMSINYFKRNLTYSVSCLKIGRPSEGDGAIAILVFTILWISVALAIISCIISAIKLYKRFNNRIHSSSPNVCKLNSSAMESAYSNFNQRRSAVDCCIMWGQHNRICGFSGCTPLYVDSVCDAECCYHYTQCVFVYWGYHVGLVLLLFYKRSWRTT